MPAMHVGLYLIQVAITKYLFTVYPPECRAMCIMYSRIWGIAFGWAYLNYMKIWTNPEGPNGSFKACMYADLGCMLVVLLMFVTGVLKSLEDTDKIQEQVVERLETIESHGVTDTEKQGNQHIPKCLFASPK